jgi:hypothetical protein
VLSLVSKEGSSGTGVKFDGSIDGFKMADDVEDVISISLEAQAEGCVCLYIAA